MPNNSKLSLLDTQKAIQTVRNAFDDALCLSLNLIRVSPPIFVESNSGLNDEGSVTFDLPSGASASVVLSLAKWKRMALKQYDFEVYTGLNTDMKAIRHTEDLDPFHSFYVDQWDWEIVIRNEDRNIEFLKSVAKSVYECLKKTEDKVLQAYPILSRKLPKEMVYVSSQEMEDEFPDLTPEEREAKYTEKYGAVFVTQIGKRLKSGKKHGRRCPDFDDWNLNGDILVQYPQLDVPVELCSMGIRVTKDVLITQLTDLGLLNRLDLPFHKALMNGELPITIGGGIGQSRMCMYLLDKIHIGEVQVSIWDDRVIKECKEKNITLL